MAKPTEKPTELEARVESRKRELIAEIIEHKKNSSRSGATEAIDRIKARLTELSQIVKEGVVDGWANINPKTTSKLDEWIARSV